MGISQHITTSTIVAGERPAAPVEPDGAHAPKRSWLDGFRRITTSGTLIPEIDGLRFVAISLVIIHHLALFVSIEQHHDEGIWNLAQHGVELFFAISGFILAVPFALHYIRGEKPVRWSWYFWRRFTRIEPPYLISLLVLTAMRVLLRHEDFSIIWWNLLWSAFYVHGFMKGMPSQINGVAWSLEIEIQFYLLMPLLALVFAVSNRWVRRGIMIAFAAAVMCLQPVYFRSVFPGADFKDGQWVPVYYYLDRHLINYIQFFIAGMVLADVYVTEWRGAPPAMKQRAAGWGDLAWLVSWPLLVVVFHLGGIYQTVGFPLLIFVLCFALFHGTLFRRLLRIELLTVIGGMCYSIYLFHNPVIQIFGRFCAPLLGGNYALSVLMLALLMIPLILLFCGLYFRAIERPCMRPDWPRRVWRWWMSKLFVDETDSARA